MITRLSGALAGIVLALGLMPISCAAHAAPQAAPAPQQQAPAIEQAPPVAPAPQQAAEPQPPPDVGAFMITPCRYTVPPPATLPPDGSGPVLWQVELCFPKQGNVPFVDIESYLFYVRLQLRRSEPSKNVWVPYNDGVELTAREDFKALMATNFLEDMLVRVTDVPFPNGVIGKIVSYEMEERARVKVVSYEGTKQIDRSKLEEQLRDRSLAIAADSMLDERKIAQVKGVVREMMMDKGFNPEVTHEVSPIPGSAKTVNVTFYITEGRKAKIRKIEIVGNKDFSDSTLRRQVKNNKQTHMFSWATGGGTWNAAKFDEDAERLRDYLQNRGYANATVGQPSLKVLEDSKDGKTQWVELQVPVNEGSKYTFGKLDFDGNTRVRTDYLSELYDVKPGELYSRKKLIEGYRKAQDFYGSGGYMEFTALPDLLRSDSPTNPEMALAALVPPALAPAPAGPSAKPPHVDVTIRITEGEQFWVHRITFSGNNTTRDNVIRRELGGLVEITPFDTRALKEGVRRLNQLGYFKELDGDKDVKVDKTTGAGGQVDLTMKLEEENRNQLQFGAGVSQYEGFFGQLSFQTANFLGRGETFTVSLQAGARAQNFQLGFTKPYLLDTNMTGAVDIHKRSLRYVGYYTQKTQGGSLSVGTPVFNWATKLFVSYSFEQVRITDLNEALLDNNCIYSAEGCGTISSLSDLSQLTPSQLEVIARNPVVYDSLLLGQGGSRTISKITPALIRNTVNHPIFPTSGRKYTAAVDLAVLGGNTQYIKPRLEGIWWFPHTSRTTLGLRGELQYIQPRGPIQTLPVFERLFLGGEYTVRGFDIRSIGPTIPNSLVVLGGNKSLLFNAEYAFTIAGPVRLILFYDAGQVRDFGEPFSMQEDVTRYVVPPPPLLLGQVPDILVDPNAPGIRTVVVGQTSAFKTSTGVELRVFMPVLNVPFRLIYAWNPQREGVLTNSLQPAKEKVFKFSVGTTF